MEHGVIIKESIITNLLIKCVGSPTFAKVIWIAQEKGVSLKFGWAYRQISQKVFYKWGLSSFLWAFFIANEKL
ncbi:unnamed protein product [Haemonchus placei]|uniref:HTH_48 domain-containing protein n=1 Tax=Haemonchus placei TaxID=6290 RepID=A0A0N4WIZ3_HAEPC|nr:unnamed protein product [Haemonchus placei]